MKIVYKYYQNCLSTSPQQVFYICLPLNKYIFCELVTLMWSLPFGSRLTHMSCTGWDSFSISSAKGILQFAIKSSENNQSFTQLISKSINRGIYSTPNLIFSPYSDFLLFFPPVFSEGFTQLKRTFNTFPVKTGR